MKGKTMQVTTASTGLRRSPALDAPLETELLLGEEFTVERERRGWAYGRAVLDGYPGYVLLGALSDKHPQPTHRVTAVRTIAYMHADCKSEPLIWLSMNARVRLCKTAPDPQNGYRKTNVGWVLSNHLSPIAEFALDYVTEAEKFLGTLYFWGGCNANHGVDCSGLNQQAFRATGKNIPRNSGQQEDAVGERIEFVRDGNSIPNLRRGDLVFWKGHAGIMRDAETLIHATEHFMAVVAEPLAETISRRRKKGEGEVTSIRRIA